jgi:hypothetical protein
METILLRAYIEPKQQDLGRTPSRSRVRHQRFHPRVDWVHPLSTVVFGESPYDSHLDLFLEEIKKANPPTGDKNLLLDARNFM